MTETNIIFFLIVAIAIAAIVLAALFSVAEWKILKKAGEKGWKSLIPFYNIFVSHHIVGMSHVWFIIEVVIWILEVVFEIVESIPDWVGLVFGIATLIFTVLSETIHILKMCDCFKKGVGFKIGMICLPSLFTLILAFSNAEYQQPRTKEKRPADAP